MAQMTATAAYGWLALVLCAALLAPSPAWAQFWATRGSEIEKIAPLLELKPGSTVAEIGAGNGAVAIAAAKKVGPTGHVYATETNPKRRRQMRNAISRAGLHNVTVVASIPGDTGLPAGCCDSAYMIDVYHHFTEPFQTDGGIFRALKPGGRLVVIDFRPALVLKPWTPRGIPTNRGGHGIPPRILKDELTRSGFRIDHFYEHWGNSWFVSNYCVVFRKPAPPARPSPDDSA